MKQGLFLTFEICSGALPYESVTVAYYTASAELLQGTPDRYVGFARHTLPGVMN